MFSKWVKKKKTKPWGKEKLLVTSNFSFSHSVFNRLVVLTGKTKGLFGKGLKALVRIQTIFQISSKSFMVFKLRTSVT